MRTYTRKKPESQFISGVHELCRLCLGNTNASSVPIFTEEPNDHNICSGLPLRIMICVGLEITRDEYLPNIICMKCYKELERFYTFRKKCDVTYQKLKSHVLVMKEKELQKKLEEKGKKHETEISEKSNIKTDPNTVQHLVLSFNADQQVELVNFENTQLQQVQVINGISSDVFRQEGIENGVETQNPISSNQSAPDIGESNSDMSLILSTILMELGIVQQQDGKLIIIDENLKTVELEGEDNSKVVLELLEEEEQPASTCPEESIQNNLVKSELDDRQNNKEQEPTNKKILLKNKEQESRGRGAWCDTCGRAFASRSVLARHRRVHSGERPHACRHCGRRFGQREVMLRHELVHREKRPFQCDVCSKSFTQLGALQSHARAHLPRNQRALTLHQCPHCGKVFLYGSGLSRHMTVHNGKVFVCNWCNHQFRDKSSLLRHLRKTHPAAFSQPTADAV